MGMGTDRRTFIACTNKMKMKQNWLMDGTLRCYIYYYYYYLRKKKKTSRIIIKYLRHRSCKQIDWDWAQLILNKNEPQRQFKIHKATKIQTRLWNKKRIVCFEANESRKNVNRIVTRNLLHIQYIYMEYDMITRKVWRCDVS